MQFDWKDRGFPLASSTTASPEHITRIGPWATKRSRSEGFHVPRGGIEGIGEKQPSSAEAMAMIDKEFASLQRWPRSNESLEEQKQTKPSRSLSCTRCTRAIIGLFFLLVLALVLLVSDALDLPGGPKRNEEIRTTLLFIGNALYFASAMIAYRYNAYEFTSSSWRWTVFLLVSAVAWITWSVYWLVALYAS